MVSANMMQINKVDDGSRRSYANNLFRVFSLFCVVAKR